MNSSSEDGTALLAVRTAHAKHTNHTAPRCAACEEHEHNADPVSSAAMYVYALGQVEARFPSVGVEKELAQASGTNQQTLHQALSKNRYLARQMWWVLTIQGMDAYLLIPHDSSDLDALLRAIEPQKAASISAAVGRRATITPSALGAGLTLPTVSIGQVYSFARDALIEAIPRPEQIPESDFRRAAGELFDRIMQRSDNVGATDEQRALNYLSVRYSEIYARAAVSAATNHVLSQIEVRRSSLGGTRTLVDVIFSYASRSSELEERYFVRCDVTEEFPFLVTKLSPYYDR